MSHSTVESTQEMGSEDKGRAQDVSDKRHKDESTKKKKIILTQQQDASRLVEEHLLHSSPGQLSERV